MKKLFLSGLVILCFGSVAVPLLVKAQQSTTSPSASPTTRPNSQPNSRPYNGSPGASSGSTGSTTNSGHKRKPTAKNTVNSPHSNSSGH